MGQRQVAAADRRAVDRGRGRLLLAAGAAAAGSQPKTSIKESSWKLDEIERELRAQITIAKRHIPQATYTWNHMGFTSVAPDVADLVPAQQGIRPGRPDRLGIQRVGAVYEGKDSGAVKADKLAARLEKLGPGLWLHIDHASTDDPEMRGDRPQGYEWVAADRRAVSRRGPAPRCERSSRGAASS